MCAAGIGGVWLEVQRGVQAQGPPVFRRAAPEISLWCLVFISGSVCGDHLRHQEELPRMWASASVGAESRFKSDQEILPKHPGVLLGTLITFRTRSPRYVM